MTGFDIGKIDEVIHGRLRLGVMAYLAEAEVASFSELKEVLQVTQGNLSIQLRKLEDAGYVEIDKSFLERKPLTRVRSYSQAGRRPAAYLMSESLWRIGTPEQARSPFYRLLGFARPRRLPWFQQHGASAR